MEFILILLIIVLVSFGLTMIVRKWANRKSIIDHPNERSSHSIPTPRGGGIAIALVWFVVLLVLVVYKRIEVSLFFALLCGLPVAAIGLIDDVISLSPKIRLLVQIICAVLALYFLGGLNMVDIGFYQISLHYLLTIFALIGIVWFTNLFNFLDGIDGYLSAEIIFVGLAIYFLFGFELPILLAAVTAGFLLWNWQPAKIFMGDVGSTLLGFIIGVLSVYYQNINQSSILLWLMLTSLFWFDATLTIFRRLKNREKLSESHKKHAYQRLVQSGFSHQKTVISSIIINVPILLLVWLAFEFPFLLLPLFFANMVYLYIIVRIVDKRLAFR
jgi:Fuc2NAc and GlcNAc transferase